MNNFFTDKQLNRDKLLTFGFEKTTKGYYYKEFVLQELFEMTVTISENGEVSTDMIDLATGESYILHLVNNTAGTFIGEVREAFDDLLERIAKECYEKVVFVNPQSKEIMAYIRDVYGDELEFLWERFPKNAIYRRADNQKWYAALLTVLPEKLGLKGEKALEIIDLRGLPEEVLLLINQPNYFPGYHMNKKHWYTICLDGSVPTAELKVLIQKSYQLALKK